MTENGKTGFLMVLEKSYTMMDQCIKDASRMVWQSARTLFLSRTRLSSIRDQSRITKLMDTVNLLLLSSFTRETGLMMYLKEKLVRFIVLYLFTREIS